MFQNWASYLLSAVTGNQEDNNETTTTGTGTTAVGVSEASRNERLRASDDGEWVLIDRDSEGNSDDASSVESFDVCSSKDDDGLRLRVPSRLTRTSSSSMLPCTSNMEESWFLTPPPCFTSTGPIHMETSPLENLLIEHPSMSVYQHNPHHHHLHRRHTHGTRSISSEPEIEDLEIEDVEDERGEQVAIVHRVTRRYGTQMMQLQERQYSKNKQAQKVQIQKASQPLKKAYLERNNKAREVNCRNRRQRRGERSQGANRSHANNNRKC